MKLRNRDKCCILMLLAALTFWSTLPCSAEVEKTFTLSVSLLPPDVHSNRPFSIEVITSNKTDHIVNYGDGPIVGVAFEVFNKRGEDITAHVFPPAPKQLHDNEDPYVLHNWRRNLRAGASDRSVIPTRSESGYLQPGSYKIRVHRKDTDSGLEVYSNTLLFNVGP